MTRPVISLFLVSTLRAPIDPSCHDRIHSVSLLGSEPLVGTNVLTSYGIGIESAVN